MSLLKKILVMATVLLGGSLLCASGAMAIGFAPAPGSPLTGLGPNGSGAVSGDFGGNSADDIVSVSHSEDPDSSGGGGIYMLINDGNGNLTETAMSACNPSQPSPCLNDWPIAGIYTADFDQDGNPDILTIREGLDRYTVWLGDGDEHLTYGGSLNPARPLAGVAALAIGDLTQDGYPDIAVGYDGGDFGVHANMGIGGPGMFSSAAPVVQSITGAGANDDDFFRSVAIGDFNGGGVDIAFGQVACDREGPGCATPYPSSNAVFVADGDGSPVNFIGASGNPHPIPAGEVITEVETIPNPGDRDGLAAATAVILSATELDGQIHTFVGNTNLTLVPNPSEGGTISTDLPPLSLTAGNLDGDDLRDLAWIEGEYEAGVALQTSDGGFERESGSPFYISDSVASYSLSMGAFNANGSTGLAFGGEDQETQTGAVSVMLAADDFKADEILDFGEVEIGSTKTLPLTISNSGVFSQWLVDQEIADDASGAFSISDHANCQELGMEPQTNCTIMVRFAPTTVGSHSAKVLVERDGPGVETTLSGTGTDPNTPGPGPGPGPGPDPDPLTKVGLKLTSAKKIKAGKKLKIKAAVKNTGNQTIKGLVLRAAVPKKIAKRPKRVTLGAIAPGATVRRTIVVKVKPRATRGKKLTVKIRANLAGKTLTSARKVVKIKR